MISQIRSLDETQISTVNVLQTYLQQPRVRATLKRSPGEQGFSLIELVVVIAVLAVLTAIALPNFLGVTEDASARTAQQGVLNAYKECKVFWARNKRDGVVSGKTVVREFKKPSITDWTIVALDKTTAPNSGYATAAKQAGVAQPDNEVGSALMACFTSAKGDRDVWAVPADITKFPIFKIATDGNRYCRNGSDTTYKDTYNVGCDATGANKTGNWQ